MANADANADTRPQRVLSGIQPSGQIHLGNYFGAIQQQVALQDDFPGECFYFIADYHALTTLQDADALRANVFDVAVTYLACGLDPDKALLFRQSDVPEVTELTWLLSTVTNMGLLQRGVSFKDKAAAGINRSVGLFLYPALMASDILIYNSTLVPVGKDQIQHIEMAQDMATHFNTTFCQPKKKGEVVEPVLVRPDYRLSKTPYVPGTDGRKMSKSYGNTIPLFASGKQLKKAVGQVVTDSTPLGEPLQAEGNNVYAILELFCDEAELEQIRGWYAAGARDGEAFGYGHAKQLLAHKIDAHFADARARREHLLANPDEVEAVLQRSAERARAVARETIDKCKRACGLR
ncbi:tryptophanyl-tRNA synthetase [Plesiocystis pacifica SIR-1]|uniref:Tryptophan--tRNA ligase n=1 Tax=Plesiocystis pacifica SIR-1 TaxID=391625 RepID=A6GAL2_9BACT|nr:tryptophan--tRNA ligase [Plesiocystis pacifica]EDM77074.1 tryptophanyl-tRNA synthetase [Plesiocystis pacifica SIR-1]